MRLNRECVSVWARPCFSMSPRIWALDINNSLSYMRMFCICYILLVFFFFKVYYINIILVPEHWCIVAGIRVLQG